jgi:long-chain fatty acid transport protein
MINKPLVVPANVVVFITTLLVSSVLLADGYRNPPEGARAVGAFGGHRAFADDANATIHNSANLVDLEQPMVQVNTTFGYGRNKFRTAGVSDQTENPFFAIPGFSAAVPFKEGKYAAGLSAYVPYGRSVEWGDDSFFATTINPSTGVGYPYSGSMMVADLTPNFAMRLTDSLSVGVGMDIYYGEVEQRVFIAPGALRSKITANGDAIGWNAAVTWKMTDKQRLTATYRSPFKIKYEGDNELSGVLNTKSDIDGTIEYPTIVGLAYGIELTDTLRAEINGEWLEFSQYETLTITDDGILGPSYSSPQNLKDTWTAGVGLAWNFKPQWTLRSGYMYLKNPTPDDTYGTLGPDENQGVVSLGLGYETGHHAIDIAYAYGLFDGRSISGSANSPDGKYDYDVSLLSLSYGYKF